MLNKGVFSSLSQILSIMRSSILRQVLQYQKIPSAESVYDRYLSHFSESVAIKEEFITEIELIINHVHYKKAQGEDYLALLFFLQDYVTQSSSQTVLQQEIDFLQQYKGPETIAARTVSETVQYCVSFQEYLQRQKQIIAENELPYNRSNSAMAFLDMQDGSFEKAVLGGLSTSKHIDLPMTVRKRNCLEQFEWHSIDILVGHNGSLQQLDAPQGYYSHIGIYSRKSGTIIEAVEEGVRQSTWQYWAENFSDFSILRFETLSDRQKQNVEEYVLSKIGEPYSLMTHKKNEEGGWYCSKFVYLALLSIGIDLDVKKGVTILPDDIVFGFHGGSIFCPLCTE